MIAHTQGIHSIARLLLEYSHIPSAPQRVSALSTMLAGIYSTWDFCLYRINNDFELRVDPDFRPPKAFDTIGSLLPCGGIPERPLDARQKPTLRGCVFAVEPFEISDSHLIARFYEEHCDDELNHPMDPIDCGGRVLYVVPLGTGTSSKSALIVHGERRLGEDDKALWRLVGATLHWIYNDKGAAHSPDWRHRLFEESNAGIIVADAHGCITDVNLAAVMLWDARGKEKLIGASLRSVCRAVGIPSVELNNAFNTDRWSATFEITPASGRSVQVRISSFVERDAGGNLRAVVISAVPSATNKASDLEIQSKEILSTLSVREQEIARLIAGHYRTKEISKHLNISESTVEFHRYRIRQKLGIVGSTGSIREVVQHAFKE